MGRGSPLFITVFTVRDSNLHQDITPTNPRLIQVVFRITQSQNPASFFFYSISITPKIDTPEVLKAYMAKFDIGPGWSFLTGKEDEILDLRRKLGLYIEGIHCDRTNPDDHNLSFL
ncbi:MAG TPA: hypothetical protein EYQ14_27900 [Gammaproteobacteria bacterium]|nr:hypothetical protein [Gammaproteobacteria bacterium]HIL99352.1 hypothetical protein [Pseudomonadales bacterium]